MNSGKQNSILLCLTVTFESRSLRAFEHVMTKTGILTILQILSIISSQKLYQLFHLRYCHVELPQQDIQPLETDKEELDMGDNF